MKTNNPKARFQNALQKAVTKAQYQAQISATIGWRRSETNVVVDVPGRNNFLYVTFGDQTVDVALNEANVPRSRFLPVRVVLRGNTYVIVAQDKTNAAVLGNVPDSPYGVSPHPLTAHSDVPSSYVGQAGKLLAVKSGEDGAEFIAPAAVIATAIDAATVSTTMSITDRIAATIGGVLRYFTYQTIRDAIKSYYDSVVATLTNKIIDASNNTLTNVGTSALSADAVSNAKLANMPEGTIKGRQAGTGTGDPEDLTATQARAAISAVGLTGDESVGGNKIFTGEMLQYAGASQAFVRRSVLDGADVTRYQTVQIDIVADANVRAFESNVKILMTRSGNIGVYANAIGSVVWSVNTGTSLGVIRDQDLRHTESGSALFSVAAITNGIRISFGGGDFTNTLNENAIVIETSGQRANIVAVTVTVV